MHYLRISLMAALLGICGFAFGEAATEANQHSFLAQVKCQDCIRPGLKVSRYYQLTLGYLLHSREKLGELLLPVCELTPSTEVHTKQRHDRVHYLKQHKASICNASYNIT